MLILVVGVGPTQMLRSTDILPMLPHTLSVFRLPASSPNRSRFRDRTWSLLLVLVVGWAAGCASSSSRSRGSSGTGTGGRSPEEFYRTTPAPSTPPASAPKPTGSVFQGKATFYGAKYQGRTTASGEKFDKDQMTAAHETLRFGTVVRVTNIENGRSVTVRVNDRFKPFDGRVIDLSESAFAQIAPVARGVVPVTIEVLSTPGIAVR